MSAVACHFYLAHQVRECLLLLSLFDSGVPVSHQQFTLHVMDVHVQSLRSLILLTKSSIWSVIGKTAVDFLSCLLLLKKLVYIWLG